MKRIIFITALSFVVLSVLQGQDQYRSKYPDIPIVDVHIHPQGVNDLANFIKVSDGIKQKYGSNLAFWIGVSKPLDPIPDVKAAGNNRILFAVAGFRAQRGFRDGGINFTAEEVIEKVKNDGFVGLKFSFSGGGGRHLEVGEAGITEIDDPRLAPFFSKLEKAGVVMTSLHTADPNGPFDNRQNWMKDPVYFWEQTRSFENILINYPNLTVIAAHGAWLTCQDAQYDYLRYMLATYPNFYVDICATDSYMHLSNRDNIRDFYIEYQDRLIFGTDGGRVPNDAIENHVDRYAKFFALLETDQIINGGFFGNAPTKGLDLPREVLEKIYYKNALKLYPGLQQAMGL